MVADADRRELRELHRAEQARFEAHAEQRRVELARTRRAYARQLEAFERERIAVLADAGPGPAPPRRRAVIGGTSALETMSLDDGPAEGLDAFFGGGGGGSVPVGELPARPAAEQPPVRPAVGDPPAEPQPAAGPQSHARPRTPESKVQPKTATTAAVLADEDIDDDGNDDDELLRFYGR